MKVFHRGLILVGAPLLLNLTIILSLGVLLVKSDDEHRQERRYRSITSQSSDLFRLAYETPLTLYVALKTQEPILFKWYDRDIEQLKTEGFPTIERWRNDPFIRDKVDAGKQALSNLVFALESLSGARKAGGLFEVLGNVSSVQDNMRNAKDGVLLSFKDMHRLAFERLQNSQRQQETMRLLQVTILSAGVVCNYLVGFFMIAFYQNGIRKRLGIIQSNTEALSEGKPLNDRLSGADEIAQLDNAFHNMAAELKQASEREKALFNNASDVICVLDEEDRFVKINPASLRLWGFNELDLLNRSLLQGVPAEDRQSTINALRAARETDEAVSFESRIITRSGKSLHTLWSVYWSSSTRNMYCVVHDITERKNAERVKAQFLSMITSDLKFPLASISAAINTLLSKLANELSEKATEKLGIAKKNVQRLLGLVNDLLQLTEFDASTLELHKQQVSVDELMTRCAQDVEAVAAKQQITIDINHSALEWNVDPDRIMQVMVNLVSNAIKFSPPCGKVTITSARVGEMIEVKVIDQGRGVPEKHRELIFEKFKQVEASDGKRKSGTGLGLPICKQIIEEHGGDIGVTSEENKGSTFWFRVPLKEQSGSSTALRLKTRTKGRETSRIKAARQNRKRAAVQDGVKPRRQLKLIYKGVLLIGTPIAFGTLLTAALSFLLFQSSVERQRELHERQIANCTSALLQDYLRVGSNIVTNKTYEGWLEMRDAISHSREERQRLAELTKIDPQAFAIYEKLSKNFDEQDRYCMRAEAIMSTGPFCKRLIDDATSNSTKLIPNLLVMVHRLHTLLVHAQVKESVHPEVQAKLRTQQAIVLGGGLTANIVLSILLAIFFSKDLSVRLGVLAENAKRLAREDELLLAMPGTDEIAELDQTFHETAIKLIESRQKERAVFDNSQDIICVLDCNAHFLSANPATLSLWGYNPKELLGSVVMNLIYEEDRARVESLFTTFQGETHFESRVVRKDGSVMWVLWSASKSAEDDQIYCIANDITKRKELEQLKQDFLAVVSHDLRTPLTSVSGVAKLVSAGAFGAVPPSPQKVLESISRNSEKLLELINDILDIEKLEAGQMNLILENVRLRELVEKSVNNACGKDTGRKVSLVDIPNLEIKADKDRLVQALSNVLSYAVGFSPTDSHVFIEVQGQQGTVEIKVRNSGPPLTGNDCEQIFDRFKEITEHDTKGGTGLALPIAKKIVESHGGSIRVSPSSAGPGNEFFIRLPLEQSNALTAV